MADTADIGKGLGRYYAPDVRDEQYTIRRTFPVEEPEKVYRYYIGGPVLDQGPTPQCVGYMWRQWANSSPLMSRRRDHPAPGDIYRLAQKVDEWPGESYDGTSVRGGAKAMQDQGMIAAYLWTWDVDECRRWILADRGTMCLGTTWYTDMSQPTKGGIARPTGRVEGGHAYLAIGYSTARGAFRCVNSWGRAWGQNGRFWLQGEDLETLLADYGEACAATQQHRLPGF